MSTAPGPAHAASRVRELVGSITGDAVTRRALRRSPAAVLGEWGLSVPRPDGPLAVRMMGRSAWLGDDDLLGPDPWAWPDRATHDWAVGDGSDPGLTMLLLGTRPAALVQLPERSADDLARWARKRGLHALLGPTAFVPSIEDARGGFSDLASASWPAQSGDGGWRTVVLGASCDTAVAAWLALLFGWDAWLGALLGYPRCCASAFADRWARTAAEFGGDMSRALLAAEGTSVVSWTSNSFARVLGAALPLHFPCGPTCAATATSTRWHLAQLARVRPDRAELTAGLLHAPTVLGPEHETVALVGGLVDGDGVVAYDPQRAVASRPDSRLARALRSGGILTRAVLDHHDAVLVIPSAPPSPEGPDALPAPR
jgi:hypothetical protein